MARVTLLSFALLLIAHAQGSFSDEVTVDLRSEGSVKPYFGDVTAPEDLWEALEARSYQGEVILIAELRTDNAHQAYSSLALHGLHHVLLLSQDQIKCDRSKKILPELACIWSEAPLPDMVQGQKRVMLHRSVLAARIVAMGFNLLFMDADAVAFRNPYSFLKAKEMGALNMISMRGTRPSTVTTALTYVQGAARRGPTSWVLAETVDRTLKWIEFKKFQTQNKADRKLSEADIDGRSSGRRLSWFEKEGGSVGQSSGSSVSSGRSSGKRLSWSEKEEGAVGGSSGDELLKRLAAVHKEGCVEASQFTDVVTSAASGKVVHWNCLGPTGANVAAWGLGPNTVLSATKSWDDKHHHALGLGEAGLRSLFMREVVSLKDDDAMAEMAAAQSYTIYMAQLFVPPPDKLALPGTEVYVSASKLASGRCGSKFIGALKDDYLYVDSLPETRKAIMAKSMGNEEVFGFAPDWLFTAWSLRGQPGYWDPGLAGSPPKQVIGLMPKEPALRDALRMAYTYWNWTVVHKAGLAEGASTAPGGLPKLVALDPAWADWLALQSPDDTVRAKEVWTGALRTLSKMAAMSGRLIVWPDLPCNTSWIEDNPGPKSKLPLANNGKVQAYGSFENLRCMPMSYLGARCLHMFGNSWLANPWYAVSDGKPKPVRGMLSVEAAHVGELVSKYGGDKPIDGNTVHLLPLAGSSPAPGAAAVEAMTVSAADVAKEMSQMEGQVIVYLNQSLAIESMDLEPLQLHETFVQQCKALTASKIV